MLEKIKTSKQLKNSGWMVGAQGFQILTTIIVGMITARYLGPSGFGVLSYTESFLNFVVVIVTLEMEGVIVKKMVAHPELEGEYLGGCISIRLISATISTGLVTLLIWVLNPNDSLKVTLILIQSIQLFFQALCIVESWFQRHLLAKYTSLARIVASLVVATYKVILYASAKSIEFFALSNSLLYILLAVMFWWWYLQQHGQKIKVNFALGLEVLKESYHIAISGLLVAIYMQLDRVMIGQMMTDSDVGLYSAAMTISSSWLIVPTALIQSFQPTIMEIKESGDESLYLKRLKQVYAGVIWLCMGVSILVSIFNKLIVRILYGAAYADTGRALVISIWMSVFSIIGTARWIWILCESKSSYVKYFYLFGAVVNATLNYLMIPVWGIEGAAFATLITQVCCNVIAPMFFKETRVHTKYVMEAFLLRF